MHRRDGRLNLLDLAPPAASRAEPGGPPPRLFIGELAISHGELGYTDLARDKPLELTLQPVSLTVRDFSTRSRGNAYALTAVTTHGESLEWHGSFGLAPLASSGRFALKSIKAATLAELATGTVPLELTSGELNLNGSYEVGERADGLALTATVEQLLIAGLGLRVPGDEADALSVPKLSVAGVTLDVARRSVEVAQVRVEQATLHAIRAHDGRMPWAEIAPDRPSAAAPASAAPPGAAPAWRLSMPRILIDGATLALEDRVPRVPATLRLAPLRVEIGGYTSSNSAPLSIELSTGVNDDGHLSAKGTLSLAPLAGSFALEAGALGLPALQPYVDGLAAIKLRSGTAAASGTVALAAGGGISYRGDARIDGFSTQDQQLGEDFIKWQSLKLARHPRDHRAAVDRDPRVERRKALRARDHRQRRHHQHRRDAEIPRRRRRRGDGGTAPAPASAPPAAAAGPAIAKAPPGRSALPLSIEVVRVAGGTMNFTDLSVRPNFSANIEELGGTITGLSGKAAARATVALDGKVDRYAPVSITGEVNYLAAVSYSDVRMGFHNVELTGFSPYSGKFAGYRIDKGKLSADLHYQIVERKLEATHGFVVSQLQLGERVESPDATSLPVRLAIALLKDRDGVIRLDLPVNGSLDDPQFRIGPIIWKLFVHLIEKAVTAPFALLGSLFGGGRGNRVRSSSPPARARSTPPPGRGSRPSPRRSMRVPRSTSTCRSQAPRSPTRRRSRRTAGTRHSSRSPASSSARAPAPRARSTALLADPAAYRTLLESGYLAAFTQRPVIPAPAAPVKDAAAGNAAAIAWLEEALKSRIIVAPAELEALAAARADAVQAALLDGTGIDPAACSSSSPGTRRRCGRACGRRAGSGDAAADAALSGALSGWAAALESRGRIRPSCAVLATSRPSRVKMLPRAKPRAPEALGLSTAYSSHSSARNGRWNHIAWSMLAICRCSERAAVRQRRRVEQVVVRDVREQAAVQPLVVARHAVDGAEPDLLRTAAAARDSGSSACCTGRNSNGRRCSKNALHLLGQVREQFLAVGLEVAQRLRRRHVRHRRRVLEPVLRPPGTSTDMWKICSPCWIATTRRLEKLCPSRLRSTW